MDMPASEPSARPQFWSEALAGELFGFLSNRLRCPETAADLTHETYLRLERKYRETEPDNARALAFRIALHLAIDYQRKAWVRSRHVVDMELQDALDATPAPASSIERSLIAGERLSALSRALDELPLNCRTAFHLHSVEGLTYTQIAERMGISKSMVNRLLAQAIAFCAARINE